jgi:hypothetical protein
MHAHTHMHTRTHIHTHLGGASCCMQVEERRVHVQGGHPLHSRHALLQGRLCMVLKAKLLEPNISERAR